ncbi:hypothetical protein [Streptomyces sp. NPDC051684]|uniref:hypothetical protein n=1 Tax=Streptomyces sp. NPDC051684 TaxID=3365670 RepID=UPI0037A7C110
MLGAGVVGWGSYDESGFMAPWPLLTGTAAVVAALVAAAFLIPRPRAGLDSRRAPRPLFVGVASCAATSGFWLVLQPSWARGLTAGATLTYAWVGFGQIPDQGSAGTVNLVGHVLLAVAAVALLCIAARRLGTRSA